MFDIYRQRVCPKRIRRAINAYRYHKPRISLEAGTGQERAATALARDDLQQGPYRVEPTIYKDVVRAGKAGRKKKMG